MAIKSERVEGGRERRVVAGLVTRSEMLAVVAPRWNPRLMSSRWGALVGGWAVDYYLRYRRAPGRDIVIEYDKWAAANADDAVVDAMSRFLSSLGEDWARYGASLNVDVLIDEAALLFRAADMAELLASAQAEFEDGALDKVAGRLSGWRDLEMGAGAGIDVLADDGAWEAVFSEQAGPIIQYPGALGNFFERVLSRDSFVSFLGAEKSGKSWFLQDVAWTAVNQGRRVAYFEVGDSSQPQVLERFGQRFAGRPMAAGDYAVPTAVFSNGGVESPTVETRKHSYPAPLDADEVRIARRRFTKAFGPGVFKLSCHAAGTLSLGRLDAILEVWARDGWHADVVVVDYADLLRSESVKLERRDQIDEMWRTLRGLSQRRHNLVVTATQANKASYGEWILTRDNITEDKRKLSHVTAMIGINQRPEEKEKGLYRLNHVCGRRLTFSETTCVWLAGNLAYSNPTMFSVF